jgi:GAF domain-containing protein
LFHFRTASRIGTDGAVGEAAALLLPGRRPAMTSGLRGEVSAEWAALRRVATMVGQAEQSEEVLAAVTAEVGQMLGAHFAVLSRYDPDGTATVIGAWARTGSRQPLPRGTRLEPGDFNIHALVFQTRQPARIDDYGDASGWGADIARDWQVGSVVAVPINLDGRLWGVIGVGSRHEKPLPADTEVRLAGFTELVTAAIANTQARLELRAFADEQAALRRVATLVTRATSPEQVFAAVTEEAGRLLAADFTFLSRYDAEGAAMVVGGWSSTADPAMVPIGRRFRLGGRNVHTLVFDTQEPVRTDHADASGPVANVFGGVGMRACVGAPIIVEGRLWGLMGLAFTRDEQLPLDTEARLAGFAKLVATAIADAQARVELRGFADEQAAMRRVATLVAHGAPPEAVFTAVATEAGRLLDVDFTVLSRYEPDGAVAVVGGWARVDPGRPLAIGARLESGGRNMHTLVFRTGRPARIDDYREATGQAADVARDWAFRSAVGAPINVDDRLWGVISVASSHEEPLPSDTETRLAGFAELVGTALANADAQAALTASRARIVAAADTARRRIERDLHDGAQQRLVTLAMRLRAARAAVPSAAVDLADEVEQVTSELISVLDELREMARGIHPTVLAEGGLRPAMKALARRSAVPVDLDVRLQGRLPEPVEVATYYVVAEALTNVAKHAGASAVQVAVERDDGVLHVRVRDDGRGGADLGGGSGLVGLKDRVEALAGRLSLHSVRGEGTAVEVTLPIDDCGEQGLPR